MTKKHFEIIARLIAEARVESSYWNVEEAMDGLAGDLAMCFRDLNPRFDTDKFIEATKQEV